MLNNFNLSVVILKKLCKNANIKISKLKKKELFGEYNRYLATKLIQKCYRKHFYKNAIDHITLEKVSYPCFIYRTKFNKHYFYEYSSIIKYIMKSGDTRDPMTRAQYSDNDLIRLDLDSKKHFPKECISFKSTLKIKNNVNYARRIRNRENEILSFQLRLDELKENILFINDVFLWDLPPEPILIDNVEYRNIDSYINTLLLELKIIFTHLKNCDNSSANFFKITTLEELLINKCPKFILNYINLI